MQTICTITLVYGVSFAKLTVKMFTCFHRCSSGCLTCSFSSSWSCQTTNS